MTALHKSPVLSWSLPLACALGTLAGCGADAETTAPPSIAKPAGGARDGEHPTLQSAEPSAPQREDAWSTEAHCVGDRCAGAEPTVTYNLARTGKKGRGSNSQLQIPQNLTLADVDADGQSDFVQFAGNRLLVSKTDAAKTGVLHLYLRKPVKRILTGDFHGDHYDQTCAILEDNSLECYGISTDRKELWWWFTQGAFVTDAEDTIVGDFDGDGRDDVLVYPRAGGPFRMYSVKGSAFFAATPSFAQGNLAPAAVSGMQVRAGDFNGDGRDDVMLVNSAGQVLSYTSVFDGTNHTFWWGFTTSALVTSEDQVTVARIDDDRNDDVVLRNRTTGATRFFRLQYSAGVLPAITSVTLGQLSQDANSLVFWGAMHTATETGAANRDDAMVYLRSWNMFVRSDARWDGSRLTYWWAYTQYAPANHTGWAAASARPFLLLKCKFSDISTTPQNDQFYRDLVLGGGGLADYFRDISYGSWDLRGSRVVDAWSTMSITNAAWSASTRSRWDRAGDCITAYGGSTAGYNVITMFNGEGDAGNAGGAGGRIVMTPTSSNPTFLAHESGHSLGYGHSFDDSGRRIISWAGIGEYYDRWDIMSAMNVISFAGLRGTSGPEMNAAFKAQNAFIPAQRITRLSPTTTSQTATLDVAAINRPEGNGALMVRIGSDDSDYHTVEYRMPSGWDQGLARATVLIHRVRAGVPYLVQDGSPAYAAERLVGSSRSFTVGTRTVTVRVNSFATAGFTANVTVTY